MEPHRFAHRLVDCLDSVLLISPNILLELRPPIAFDLDIPILMNAQAMTLQQLVNTLKEGLLKSGELESEVLGERVFVQLAMIRGMLEDAFDLRSEDELAALLRVVERLDAEKIACAE